MAYLKWKEKAEVRGRIWKETYITRKHRLHIALGGGSVFRYRKKKYKNKGAHIFSSVFAVGCKEGTLADWAHVYYVSSRLRRMGYVVGVYSASGTILCIELQIVFSGGAQPPGPPRFSSCLLRADSPVIIWESRVENVEKLKKLKKLKNLKNLKKVKNLKKLKKLKNLKKLKKLKKLSEKSWKSWFPEAGAIMEGKMV